MNPTHPLPLLALTLGDPAGIGPEICLEALADPAVRASCRPLVYGDRTVLEEAARAAGKPPCPRFLTLAQWRAGVIPEGPAALDFGRFAPGAVTPGRVDAATGAAAYEYIAAAIGDALAGRVAGVVTGPIHKEALRLAGISHPGHTEIFEALTGARRVCMMLTSDELTCSFVTTHIGYRDVPAALSVERVLDVLELTHEAVSRMRGRPARMVLNGLNPHAGENGLFGDGEEECILRPALEEARRRGMQVVGPLPPDTAFLPRRRAETDAFICLYHDQGHIPLKMLAFDTAINVTLGLPIIRTSVDHGTALDIAWQGRAQSTSLRRAIDLAVRLQGRAP